MALYFIHGAFILFHGALIFWQRAFVQIFLSAGKRFIIALLLNLSKCKQVLIFYSSKYGTVSNFLFQNMHQLLFKFLDVKRLIS
jgi:hypothetical protein